MTGGHRAEPFSVAGPSTLVTVGLTILLTLGVATPALAFAGRYRAGTDTYLQAVRVVSTGANFRVTASVGTKGCVGEVEGVGRVERASLVLRARSDFGECRLTLTRDGRALVVAEDNCLAFHGSACEFAGTYQPVPDAPQ